MFAATTTTTSISTTAAETTTTSATTTTAAATTSEDFCFQKCFKILSQKFFEQTLAKLLLTCKRWYFGVIRIFKWAQPRMCFDSSCRGSGGSTAVEHTSFNREPVGSNPVFLLSNPSFFKQSRVLNQILQGGASLLTSLF